MWRCLNCENFSHDPFIYYGGCTGYDPETLSCSKQHFYVTNMSISDLRAANEKGDNCDDFSKGTPKDYA